MAKDGSPVWSRSTNTSNPRRIDSSKVEEKFEIQRHFFFGSYESLDGFQVTQQVSLAVRRSSSDDSVADHPCFEWRLFPGIERLHGLDIVMVIDEQSLLGVASLIVAEYHRLSFGGQNMSLDADLRRRDRQPELTWFRRKQPRIAGSGRRFVLRRRLRRVRPPAHPARLKWSSLSRAESERSQARSPLRSRPSCGKSRLAVGVGAPIDERAGRAFSSTNFTTIFFFQPKKN
jgi:hypothetical protein